MIRLSIRLKRSQYFRWKNNLHEPTFMSHVFFCFPLLDMWSIGKKLVDKYGKMISRIYIEYDFSNNLSIRILSTYTQINEQCTLQDSIFVKDIPRKW